MVSPLARYNNVIFGENFAIFRTIPGYSDEMYGR